MSAEVLMLFPEDAPWNLPLLWNRPVSKEKPEENGIPGAPG